MRNRFIGRFFSFLCHGFSCTRISYARIKAIVLGGRNCRMVSCSLPRPQSSVHVIPSRIKFSVMDLSIALFIIVIGISHSTTVNGIDFQCPKKNGQFEDPVQCDKFYECKDGIATAKLCPDGLVFDPLNRKVNKCDQPFSVDCGERTELQNPQSNHLCPRRNGYFAHPDEKICNIFYNCIEGEGTEIVCPNGLHFDEYAGTCAWPATAGRTGCGEPEEMKLKDGFTCPKEKQQSSRVQNVAHPVYSHPDDCQKFYVCLNGITPREQGCSVGEVFNEQSQKCDRPELVPGCEDWYKDDPQVQNKNKKTL